MLDEGYATGIANIVVNPHNFPELNQTAAVDRLVAFQKAVQRLGWRGLGLWSRMCNGPAKGNHSFATEEMYANWSKQANVTYWKIDGPDNDCACSSVLKKTNPGLTIEHGHCTRHGPFNSGPNGGQIDFCHPSARTPHGAYV